MQRAKNTRPPYPRCGGQWNYPRACGEQLNVFHIALNRYQTILNGSVMIDQSRYRTVSTVSSPRPRRSRARHRALYRAQPCKQLVGGDHPRACGEQPYRHAAEPSRPARCYSAVSRCTRRHPAPCLPQSLCGKCRGTVTRHEKTARRRLGGSVVRGLCAYEGTSWIFRERPAQVE